MNESKIIVCLLENSLSPSISLNLCNFFNQLYQISTPKKGANKVLSLEECETSILNRVYFKTCPNSNENIFSIVVSKFEDISEDWNIIPTVDNEKYLISTMNDKSILIMAPTTFGLSHAFQSLLQLFEKNSNEEKINNKINNNEWNLKITNWPFTIEDKPLFAYRGLLLDSARNFVSVDFITTLITQMSSLKLNVLHWHFIDDHSFPWKSESHPELFLPFGQLEKFVLENDLGNPEILSMDTNLQNHQTIRSKFSNYTANKEKGYSNEDIKKIVSFARTFGIRVIPEISMPNRGGSWIKAKGDVVGYCTTTLCANPQTLPLLPTKDAMNLVGDLLIELSTLFLDPVIHLGGDVEYSTSMCGIELLFQGSLLCAFEKELIPILRSLGKKTIRWQEHYENTRSLDCFHTHANYYQMYKPSHQNPNIVNNLVHEAKKIISSLDFKLDSNDWWTGYNSNPFRNTVVDGDFQVVEGMETTALDFTQEDWEINFPFLTLIGMSDRMWHEKWINSPSPSDNIKKMITNNCIGTANRGLIKLSQCEEKNFKVNPQIFPLRPLCDLLRAQEKEESRISDILYVTNNPKIMERDRREKELLIELKEDHDNRFFKQFGSRETKSINIQTASENYKVWIIQEKERSAEGFLYAENSECTYQDDLLRYFSTDPEMDLFIRTAGPEMIRLRLFNYENGSERVVRFLNHIGNCVYYTPYNLSFNGDYYIDLQVYHNNFLAYDEVFDEWEYPVYIYLVDPDHFNINSFTNPKNILTVTSSKYNNYEKIDKETLPICNEDYYQAGKNEEWYENGRFINAPDLKPYKMIVTDNCMRIWKLSTPHKYPYNDETLLMREKTTLRDCVWAPYSCRLLPTDEMDCLKDLNLIVVGDSYISRLEEAAHGVCDVAWGDEANEYKGASITRVESLLPGKYFLPQNPDVVLFNYGNHPASKHHWTYLQYQNGLEKQVASYRDYNMTFLVWMETQLTYAPSPDATESGWMTNARDRAMYRDHRSAGRILKYNQIAEKIMEKFSVAILPIFQSTVAFDITHDHCHTTHTVSAVLWNSIENYFCISRTDLVNNVENINNSNSNRGFV